MTEFGLGLAALCIAALCRWYFLWRAEARQLQSSGYVPPATSWIAKLFYAGISHLVAFLTVGPVTVVGKKNNLTSGRVVYVGNHQVPADFAVLYKAVGRHYRALGDAAQFPGFKGLLAAWLGVISVTYQSKEARAAGEAASVKVMAGSPPGPRFWTMVFLQVLMLGFVLLSLSFGHSLPALLAVALSFLLASSAGGEPALTIAPQGALMPDNELRKEEFRAGAVRIARAAADRCGEPVHIVPVAIYYKRDPKDAHWSHRYLKRTRSLFLGMRNPKHWDPLFKIDLDSLSAGKRSEVEKQRAEKLAAYKNSHFTIYGAVAVVGEPINPIQLPQDPCAAIEMVRVEIAHLLEMAKKH